MCVYYRLILAAILVVVTVDGGRTSLKCRSKNAGIYYIRMQDDSLTNKWYCLVQLESDGGAVFVGSDQHSLEPETESDAVKQPYSALLGKWTCKKKSTKQVRIQINSYHFEFPIASLPEGNFVTVVQFQLNINSKTGQINGTATGRFLNLSTKFLGNDVEKMKDDVVAGPLTVGVQGYSVERFET